MVRAITPTRECTNDHAFCSDDFQCLQRRAMGGDPTTFVVSQTAHTPPGVVPPPLHLARACNARVGQKWPRYALDRSAPFRATSGCSSRPVGRLRVPKGSRSVRIVFADVTADDVRKAAERLRGVVRRTELRRAPH